MSVKRRDFLKVLGAGAAAGTAVGCGSDHVQRLIPYLVSPDETVPGVSTFYATACRECAAGCGVIAATRDGRAIKLEGNPTHPSSKGALCARGQASLQGLYNPDRFKSPMIRENGRLTPTTWDAAIKLLSSKLASGRGKAVFLNEHETGSFPAFLDAWLAAFGLPAHIGIDTDAPAATVAANRQTYGVAWPGLDFSASQLIVSFGADFLETWGASVPQQLDWADARAKLADAPRFIYVGPRRSLTGLNADEWIPAKAGSELAIANAILTHLGHGTGTTIAQAAEAAGVPAATLQKLADRIGGTKPSLILSGTSSDNALDVALAVNAINQAAGNVGVTIKTAAPLTIFDGGHSFSDLRAVADRMRAGDVPLLFVRGLNPVYATPKAMDFAGAMEKVPFKVGFSSYPDETMELCDLILPDHHALESWGDVESVAGTITLQQPTMDPVFDTKPTADVLLALAKADATVAPKFAAADYRAWLMSRFPGGAVAFTNALSAGTVTAPPLAPTKSAPAAQTPKLAHPISQSQGDYDLVVYYSPTIGDGSGANKPWLQELPDPVTKIAWQTVVEIHPETTRKLGVANGDLVEIKTDQGAILAPVYMFMGVRPDTVAIALGRGHTAYGRYAKTCGSNALDLIPAGESKAGALVLTATKCRITKQNRDLLLVSTEGSARQHGRGIARTIAVADLGKAPEKEGTPEGYPNDEFRPGLRSPVAADAQGNYADSTSKDNGIYDEGHWSGMAKRRWAMTVDLARCTGCSACVTACYTENNIPTVGAWWQGPQLWSDTVGFGVNVTRGREMAWLRIERYYEGAEHEDGQFDPEFEARFVPMMCQHCGNAPCEPVCPVYATYHAPDGLNVQVYNRCVGTRYCSNNCPYKVRYFNWFGYGETNRPQYAFPEPLNWQLNPDVTVRGKGVMEKCSFCIQRIRSAENRARVEGRNLKPDEFTTACAQGCPSRAITWGDAADPAWSVSKHIDDPRAYHVFEELNTFTAVVYLKKVTR
ncbi:MAG TPA: molybdopterin-dependent oxidoreductase [Gemmatimonadaceae bacterium]|nr:molybdopterin-dependent oxidoreductase [Gemmatimonadaceae bacterium]